MIDSVKNLLFSSGGASIILGLVTTFIIFGGIILAIWWFWRTKKVYRHNFHLLNYQGKLIHKKGRVIRNKQGVEKFQIDGYQQQLAVKEPNAIVNGMSTRIVSFDGTGKIAYIEEIEEKNVLIVEKLLLDKDNYKRVSLTPEERSSMADTVIEAGQKYGKTPIEMKVAIGFAIALLLISVGGMYAMGKIWLAVSDNSIAGMKDVKEITQMNKDNTQVIKENSNMVKAILTYISNGKYNVTLIAD